MLIFFPSSSLKSLVPYALPPFVQETLVSLCVDVHPPFMTSWSNAWKEFVRGLRVE